MIKGIGTDLLEKKRVEKSISKFGDKFIKKVLTEKIDDLHKLAKALLVYETLTGDEIRDLILKNIQPAKLSKKTGEDSDDSISSAIDSIGLKPKPAL